MRTASDAFKIAAMHGNVIGQVECTLTDGSAVTLNPADVMQGGIGVTSATSNGGSFGIGSAIIGRCTIRLRNEQRQLNSLNLSGARVQPFIGADVDGEIEWFQLGTYWVEPNDIYDDVVSLSCLDSLSRMELPVDALTTTFPATLGTFAADVCDMCGLNLITTAFHNSDYTVNARPSIDGKSCLEVLAWIAQVAGCYVIADYTGGVRIQWYALGAMDDDDEDSLDGGGFHFEVDSADGGGFHFERDTRNYDGGSVLSPFGVTALKSLTAGVTPHTVTGLAVSDVEGTQYVEGEDGYVLHIHDNPLIEAGRAQDVATNVAPYTVGMSLRQVRVSMPGSPTLQAGDPVRITDRHGETYDFYATTVSWSSTGTLTASCDTESSSPLVRTFRRATNSVDSAQVEGIVNGVLDQELSDLTDLAAFDDINTALTDLQTDVGTLQTDVGDIQTDMGDVTTDVGTLQSDVGGLQSGVTGLDSRVTALEQSTSVGQWIIQVNGVAQTTGTINFVT